MQEFVVRTFLTKFYLIIQNILLNQFVLYAIIFRNLYIQKEMKHSSEYLQMCCHPTIQALRPTTENTKNSWIPTLDQLKQLLNQKLPYPERSNFSKTDDGWIYETYFKEYAADYGTYIDTYRQFVGDDPNLLLLKVLGALLGIEERWMV